MEPIAHYRRFLVTALYQAHRARQFISMRFAMIRTRQSLLAILVAGLAVSACVPTTTGPIIVDSGVPAAIIAADEQLCLQAVSRQTANSVRVVDTRAVPGETTVYVGVGSQNTQFICRVLNGRVSAITAL
jgi:hypothetical protein